MDKNINSNSRNNDTTMLYVLIVIAAIYFIMTSIPAVIISIVLTLVFLRLKINKLIFSIVGLVLAVLLNLKMKFIQQYLISSINFIKNVFSNPHNAPVIFKTYILHINLLWQLIIAVIISGLVTYCISNNQENKQESKSKNKDISKEKRVNKSLEKLKVLKHNEGFTTIGVNYDNFKEVKLSDEAKHILIAGTTGSGKTVAISNFIENCMQKEYPVFAVDGKGDLDKGSLLHYMESLSKKYNRKLYIINFVKPEYSDFYNPFLNAGMTEAKDMLISMNDWTEPHYQINTERYLQQLIKILNRKGIKLDLNTIINYSPKKFKKLILDMKNNGDLEIEEYSKLNDIIEATADIVNSAMARFATTAESEAGIIFDKSGIDIYTALKEKANILIILDSLGKPALSKQVGRLAVLDAKKAVSKLFGDKTRKFFILDEFNVYASDIAVDLLNKSRSANVTCIPAFQSLSDLDKAGGTALRNQVIENCNNYIIMRQNSADSSQEWEKIVGQEKKEKYTYGIQENNGLFKTGNVTTGTGSMYEVMDSKHNATEIQNLQTGQGIFISKDQQLDEKIKIRYFPIDTQTPVLEKKKNINTILTEMEIEHTSIEKEISKNDIKDIEDMLK